MEKSAMTGNAAETVGFIGTGMMGTPIARAMAAGGLRVTVYDIDPAKACAAAEGADGLYPVDSVAEVAAQPIVVLMLPSSDVVDTVVLRQGLAAAMRPGSLLIDMSSSVPDRTAALGAELASRDIEFVDAPVSGGVARARQASLTIMAGGSPSAVQRARPVLEPAASKVVHIGSLGSGHAIKSLNNVLSACGLLIASEASEVATRYGINSQVFLDVVNTSTGRNDATENKLAQYVLSGRFNSGFAAALMAKDLHIAAQLATSTGAPTTLLHALSGAWDAAIAALPAGADQTEVARYLAAGRTGQPPDDASMASPAVQAG